MENIEILKTENTYQIDYQSEFNQVALWCKIFGKNFSICYQNGDMNGNYKNHAIFDNDGADSGIKELRNILIDSNKFNKLIDLETYWMYEKLDALIYEFFEFLAEKEEITEMIYIE